MKIIIDANISWRIVKFIESYFTQCLHAQHIDIPQPARDVEIRKYAIENEFHILTFDVDFIHLTTSENLNSKIILLKTGNIYTKELSGKLISNILNIEMFINDKNRFILEIY